MKRFIYLALTVCLPFYLVGCASSGGTTGTTAAATTPHSGFGLAIDEESENTAERYEGVRLDVIVPVFDPGLPDDPDQFEKLGIWPEVRRAEAVRFAGLLKKELQATNAFGDVRIAPDIKVSGDLYVLGEIKKSNGEDIAIKIRVYDVSAKRWLKKSYSHRVKEYHWQDLRQKGKDPYQPVFRSAAKDIAKLLKKRSPEKLRELRAITELQFANVFVDGAFAHLLQVKDKKVSLVALPARDDPMLARTQALRVADGLFMDKMQTHYDSFIQKTDTSYVAWQEYSLSSAKQKRVAKSKAATRAILGGLLLLGAAAAADDSSSSGHTAAVAAAAVGGSLLIRDSFKANSEGKFHHDNLMELGRSLNFDVAQQVIEVEDATFTLRGDVQDHFVQWRRVLKEIYEREGTPNITI